MKYEKPLKTFVEQTFLLRLIWRTTLFVKPFARWSIYREVKFNISIFGGPILKNKVAGSHDTD